MRTSRFIMAAALTLAAPGRLATAQNVNPDVSLIGDLRAFVTSDDRDPRKGNLQLSLESVEFAFQGYLNPYARGDVFASYTDRDGFKVEEAYVTILRGLPAGLQLKAGRYRVDFGKLNQVHPHAYSFLETPLIHREYLGEEGLQDTGIGLNMQIPVGTVSVTPAVNLLKGEYVGHWIQPTPAGPRGDIDTSVATVERLGVFVPTGDVAGFEAGLNAMQGTFDTSTNRKVSLIGGDIKYRWAPGKYHALTLQGEWIRSRRDFLVAGGAATVTSQGFYLFGDLRFAQRWNAGALVERAQAADAADHTIRRDGVFSGFQLMEETTAVRLLLRRTDDGRSREPYGEAILQLVFSLGPHAAHRF